MKYRKLKNSELNRLSVTDFKNSDKTPLLVVLDNIRSLNNIGSVFRTCDAFAIEKVYLCGITAQPPHNDINKTALGATESVAWEYATDVLTIINKLKADGVKIIAIEQAENSVALQDFELAKNQKYAVIFGNEVKGIQQSLVNAADYCVEIPQVGTKHSLNISVSCGVVLWDLFKKIRL
ncbi:MAG: RNA methyltransferase [Flavobacteriales bacterium CG03_land_8_20_14_0_80_35_15]|nr:RNA methyltransferase [Zetaproteobacteria bacterium]OIO13398.1 MAG: RNA methyltransferase [Flavobacteriaceae bacterium CG1_02_35_72]PIV16677.1 MAG: RNA methyltransferase [Flavobacteriales bacterium CG03_land_8_20_14_0_80_35_15]PJA06161.1 MAG: RNA methyltransferase [Flavobacteriales bacterium CG_4_10_14_0_2_um_filter_35_18]